MNKRTARIVIAVALLAAVCLLAWGLLFRRPAQRVQARVQGLIAPVSSEGFERVEGPRPLVFPRDHGPHPDFQTEWWYYTGNLESADGSRYGYQLTFFRRAVQPPTERQPRQSTWDAGQIYMAHFTLTDVRQGSFRAFERFERGAAGLAGAAADPLYSVWLRDWSVEQAGEDEFHLRAAEQGVALDLRLVDRKGIILQGDQGYSRKGPEPGNASLYYSQTRLESTGTITIDGRSIPVTGWSWLDREISTSVLGEGQVGWDWFALRLDDGSELVVYQIRRADGSADPFSYGLWVAPDGSTVVLGRGDFTIDPLSTWRSPHTGGEYPSRWSVQVPSLGIDLTITPLVADQELNVSVAYWEGAVEIEGSRAGKPVAGAGYVELTGYAGSLEDRL